MCWWSIMRNRRLGIDQTKSLLAYRQMDEELKSYLAAMEERSRSRTEMVETRLLNDFWKWARTADARYRQHQAVVGGLEIRVQTIEDRLTDLEQRAS